MKLVTLNSENHSLKTPAIRAREIEELNQQQTPPNNAI